jgi:hypothetical protein
MLKGCGLVISEGKLFRRATPDAPERIPTRADCQSHLHRVAGAVAKRPNRTTNASIPPSFQSRNRAVDHPVRLDDQWCHANCEQGRFALFLFDVKPPRMPNHQIGMEDIHLDKQLISIFLTNSLGPRDKKIHTKVTKVTKRFKSGPHRPVFNSTIGAKRTERD